MTFIFPLAKLSPNQLTKYEKRIKHKENSIFHVYLLLRLRFAPARMQTC
jgi:hypothetical protein